MPVSLRLSSRWFLRVVSLRSRSEIVSCTGGRPPVQETISDRDRKETTRKNQRELSRKLTGK